RYLGADEDVSHPPRIQLEGRRDRRYHAGGSSPGAHLGPDRGAGHPGRRPRYRVRLFFRKGRRAPPLGPGNHQSVPATWGENDQAQVFTPAGLICVPVLLQNQQRIGIDRRWLGRTAEAILTAARAERAELSVLLVSDRR